MPSIYSGPGTYIAVCNSIDFKSHYLSVFTVPDEERWKDVEAAWYFLNRVDFEACLEKVLPFNALIGSTLFMPATTCSCGSIDVAMGREKADEKDDGSVYFWMQCGGCGREVDGYTLEGCFAKWRGLPVPKEEEEAKAAFQVQWEEEEDVYLTNSDEEEP